MGGDLIREARRRAGLSQQELADRLGTSQSVIARWENGRRSPTVEALLRVVRATGLDVSMAVVAYDHDHDLLIEQSLAMSPRARLEKMTADRRGIDRLLDSVRRRA